MGFDKVLCAKASSSFLEPRLINHLAVAASYNLQKLLDYFNIPYYKRKTYFLIHPHYILFLMEMSNAFLLKLTDLTIMKFVVRIHLYSVPS